MVDTITPGVIPGTNDPDDFIGTAAGTYSGGLLDGDDTLQIQFGLNVTVDGGNGNDSIGLGNGNHSVTGGAGDDRIESFFQQCNSRWRRRR